jgi:halogenation protein CepH
MDPSEEFDLIVIGGGPGGSTLAALVAMLGHRVLLLEKEKLPRYQIGESLLPATVTGLAKLLGIKEEIDSAGFPRKAGGTFRWGTNPEPWSFSFDAVPELGIADGYSYQVERYKFDNMLLENAKRKGVDVRQECPVLDLIQEGGRFVGVTYLNRAGERCVARARFIGDVSGNTGGFHRYVGERIFSKFFQNVALFGYFEGGQRQPAPRQGNIICAAFKRGWFWYIPLSDRLTSVGAVIAKEEAEVIKRGHEEAYMQLISECPLIQDYLSQATRVKEGIYGKLRIRKDYSYQNTRFWRPGLFLVGDAACFIDPLFSSGVHLATYSALLAARSINTLLQGGSCPSEEQCFTEYEQRYRREFGIFYQFLLAFYDMHHDEASYFWMARKVLDTEERANEAFVRLVAGATSDKFFGAGQDISNALQKDPLSPNSETLRLYDDMEHEPRQILSQSVQGANRQPEVPLFSDGLIPSEDGLHWKRPAREASFSGASS